MFTCLLLIIETHCKSNGHNVCEIEIKGMNEPQTYKETQVRQEVKEFNYQRAQDIPHHTSSPTLHRPFRRNRHSIKRTTVCINKLHPTTRLIHVTKYIFGCYVMRKLFPSPIEITLIQHGPLNFTIEIFFRRYSSFLQQFLEQFQFQGPGLDKLQYLSICIPLNTLFNYCNTKIIGFN